MKLHELISEKNILPIRSALDSADTFQAYGEIDSSLLKYILKTVMPNVKILGTGSYANTVELPGGNLVCKIWSPDPAYDVFVKFCEENKSTHLPYFLDSSAFKTARKGLKEGYSGTFKYRDAELNYAVMEKLTPITLKAYNSTFLPLRAWLCHLKMSYSHQIEDVIGYLQNYSLTRDIMAENKIYYIKDFDQHWPKLEAALGNSIPDSWKSITTKLNDYSKNHNGISYDLHNENVMKRGSTLVITDPFIDEF